MPPAKLSFTAEGRIAFIVAVGVGLAAINTGNNLLFLILGWLLAFIIASGVMSERALRGLQITRQLPATVTSGVPFEVELMIANPKRHAVYALLLYDCERGAPVDKQCFFLKVPAGATQRATYRHTLTQRGPHQFDQVWVRTKFPFSLFMKTRVYRITSEVLVLPSAASAHALPASQALLGESQSARLARRGEFYGLRELRVGDDRRDIHWRSSARTGRLQIREFVDEQTRRLMIAVDNAQSAQLAQADPDARGPLLQDQYFALERAIATANGLAQRYLAQGWTVGAIARGMQVPLAAGKHHAAKIAHALAALPLVTDDVSFPSLPGLGEALLIVPADLVVQGRPPVRKVVTV